MFAPVIRTARPEDARELGLLGRETFVDTFVSGFGIPYPKTDLEAFLDAAYSTESMSKKLIAAEDAWWVAEQDGALVGFANAGPNGLPHPEASPGDMELRRLYVARAAQGAGLGARLMAKALDWMQSESRGRLWIGVWSGNEKAQRFYAARGFAKVGEYDYPVGSWLDREFILRRG